MKPVSSGYADTNSIRLYYEIHGQGEPLVLIHGG
jgi:pimeloyl-ACP methyl ester carboxylesterase